MEGQRDTISSVLSERVLKTLLQSRRPTSLQKAINVVSHLKQATIQTDIYMSAEAWEQTHKNTIEKN